MSRTHTHWKWIPIRSAGAAVTALSLLSLGCAVEEERDGMGRDLDVGTTERTLKVPKVDVDLEEERVEVPYVDLDLEATEPGASEERYDRTRSARADIDADLDVEARRRLDADLDARRPVGESDAEARPEGELAARPTARAETSAHRMPGGDLAADPARPAPDVPEVDGISQDRELSVELEVPEEGYAVQIEEIYLANDQLVVISRLDSPPADVSAGPAAQRAPTAAVPTQPRAQTEDAPYGQKISDTVIIHAPPLQVSHYIIGDQPATIGSDLDYQFIETRSDIADVLRRATRVYRATARDSSAAETRPEYSRLSDRQP